MSSPHLSVATAIEKDRIASDVAFVLCLEIDVVDLLGAPVETLYFVKNTEDIFYQGHEYIAANFDANINIDVASEPKLEVKAEDVSGVIRDRMNLYGGAIGCEVRLLIVNTGNLAQAPEVRETFKVRTSTQNGYQVSFVMGTDNPVSERFPKRLQYKNQCTYKYKGTRCKYAGTIKNCDFSYFGDNGCKAHGNEAHYGGFLGLNNYG